MINFKQEELIKGFMRQLKEKFPEVEFINVSGSCEGADSLWINVSIPDGDDYLIDVIEFASDILTDIFLEYGYHMLLMPTTKKAA